MCIAVLRIKNKQFMLGFKEFSEYGLVLTNLQVIYNDISVLVY